ncbi:MAG: ferrous iron transport protein B [Ruminiclostridium sp.]|nr:ferrous iron transport protein B [Ruminiclostridium sp.]
MGYTFALVGNPNCGKTTMFNEITGSTQYVGNWPGVTVEKKEGKAKKNKEDIKIIDLPGIYSLSPYTMEEIISRDYILNEKPDVIINIVEATNIERNLYLTTQLMETGIPVVAALNMMDAAEARGDQINITTLENLLGVPVVPTSASKGKGITKLIERALETAKNIESYNANSLPVYDKSIQKHLNEIEKELSLAEGDSLNNRWTTVKLLEGDDNVLAKLKLRESFLSNLKQHGLQLEKEYDNDIESIITDNRYRFITEIVSKAVKKKSRSNLTVSDKIDKVVTNRILAIPLFLFIMFGIFQITFGIVGTATIDILDGLINEKISGAAYWFLTTYGAADWLVTLVVDGIIAGMGSIFVFVPQIMLLFLFISLLEDSGYMARAAFVMDKLMRKLGLSGKSFIPMIMGFGCSVPAIMATRTLENEKDRKLTIILTPFMSCGARLPIYALFASAFFVNNQSVVIFSMYLLGILIAALSGILLKNTVLKGNLSPFVMELPPYRIPTLKSVFIHMWDRATGFIKKAGTVIFAASVIIWFCQSFSFSFKMVSSAEDSIFGIIGKMIAPVFSPLGFGDWKSSVALLTGVVAKEIVVATMGILHGAGDAVGSSVELLTAIQTVFTPLKAYAFMAFTLLYMPCVAAFGAIKREMNSWKWTLFAVGYQTGIAWIVAFIIFQVGSVFGL